MSDGRWKRFAPAYEERPAWATAETDEFPELDEVTYLTRGGRACSEPGPSDVAQAHDDHGIAMQLATVDRRVATTADEAAGRHRADAAVR